LCHKMADCPKRRRTYIVPERYEVGAKPPSITPATQIRNADRQAQGSCSHRPAGS